MSIIYCVLKNDALIGILLLILLFARKAFTPCLVHTTIPLYNGFISEYRAHSLWALHTNMLQFILFYL